MADDVKIEYSVNDKGHRVEKRTYEIITEGKKEQVIETYVELVQMELSERVTEDVSPVVSTRKKEVFKNGKKVDDIIENVVKKQEISNDQILTKDELIKTLNELLKNTVKEEPVKESMSTKDSSILEYVETGAYMVLSAELAFCAYHLFLKIWL